MSDVWWFVVIAIAMLAVAAVFLFVRRARRSGTVLASRAPKQGER